MKHLTKKLVSPTLVLLLCANAAFANSQSTTTNSTSSSNALVNGGNTSSGANAQVSGIIGGTGGTAAVSGVQGGSAQVSGVSGGSAQVSGVSGGNAQVSGVSGGTAQISGVEGGNANVSGVQGGSSQSSASGGSGGTSSADVSGVQGIGSINQVFDASTPPPYMPNSVTGPVISPNLFSIMGGTAQISGVPMLSNHFFSTAYHDVSIGNSKGTKIIYNGSLLPKKPEMKDRKVFFSFDGVAEGELVGSLTVQSRKGNADEVDFATLIYDATQYIGSKKELKGFNITLLSTHQAISSAMGVDSKSSGFSLSPLVSGLVNGPAGALLGLASGYSKTGGVTVPTSIVGCTFLVLVESENSRRIDIARNYKAGVPIMDAQSNGNGGKKYEATRTK